MDEVLTRETELLRRKLRRQLLRDLFHGTPPAESTLEGINDYYEYRLRPGMFSVVMIRFQPKDGGAPPVSEALEWADRDARMFFSSDGLLEFETLPAENALYCLLNLPGWFSDWESSPSHFLTRQRYRYMDASHRYHPYHFAIGSGLPAYSVSELGTCFHTARSAVDKYTSTLRTNRLSDSATQLSAMTRIMAVLHPARRAAFSHYLETLQEERLFDWVDEVFRELLPALEQFPTIAYQLPFRVFALCLDTAGSRIAADPTLQQTLKECGAATEQAEDYDALCALTKAGLHRFFLQYSQSVLGDSSQAVSSAKAFLRDNYACRLTLREIADHVHLNPQYFSVLFKRETGRSVTDHLTSLRMEQAKALLKETLLPINEVARAVSYEDPDYFSRVFRKTCALSPRQYRTLVRNG